jgi:ABC-type nitrate/sulfonate/bicarbonate transport system substrate-binding protein
VPVDGRARATFFVLVQAAACGEGYDEERVLMSNNGGQRKRSLRLLVIGCLVAVTVASATGWFSTNHASAAETTRNDSTITIAITGPTATQDVPLLAAKKGYFAQLGLDVNVVILPTSQALPAVASGQVQFVEGAEPGVSVIDWSSTYAATHTKPVKLLGYWQPKAGGIVVVGAPGINKVSDFKGKTLGITTPGGASAILLDLVLSRVGHLTAKDVTVVPLGTLPAEVAAFNAGRIQGMNSTEPLTSQLLAGTPGAKVVFDEGKYRWILGGIAGYMPWVRSHPAQTVRVLAAINQALADYHNSPADAKAIIGSAGNITDQSLLDTAYKSAIPFITRKIEPIPEAAMRAVLYAMKTNGTRAANPNRWKEEVDTTYVKAAAKFKFKFKVK